MTEEQERLDHDQFEQEVHRNFDNYFKTQIDKMKELNKWPKKKSES